MPFDRCLLCESEITDLDYAAVRPIFYSCQKCGDLHFGFQAYQDLANRSLFSEDDKKILSIWTRNEFEKRGKIGSDKPLTSGDLKKAINGYRRKDALELMDIALLNLDNIIHPVGDTIKINIQEDHPYYHCFNQKELFNILRLLTDDAFVKADPDEQNPHNGLRLMRKGYERIRQLKKPGKDSNQCFVAMWFVDEMDDVYEKAIKPAIELDHDETTVTGYESVLIKNVEHVNDINDEIIAQVRRSKFMVCDLTGYRGGVYFEAGFAYGLGFAVIYTCRKDWSTAKPFYNSDGNKVEYLFAEDNKEVPIQQEGIHFDLAHRNRIEWYNDDLEDFREKLRNRIKAVIV